MKKQRKLNLRKLSIAKLSNNLQAMRIKGGTDDTDNAVSREGDCKTEGINCGTSVDTRPGTFTTATSDPNDPRFSVVIGTCV